MIILRADVTDRRTGRIGTALPLLLFLLLSSCRSMAGLNRTGETGTGAVRAPMSQAGINWGYPGRRRETPALFDEMGLNWFRIDFYWSEMEREQGEWNFSDHDRFFDNMAGRGYHYVGVLGFDTPWIHENPEGIRQIDPGDLDAFLNYVERVVGRYGDVVDEWEIWNEPNLPLNTFWTGSDRDFIELTLATLARIRSVDPHAKVQAGSLWRYDSSYLGKLDRAGILDRTDYFSFHPYYDKPEKILRKTEQLTADLERRGFPGELRITEAGFNTYGITPTSCPPEEQGRMVMETLAYLGERGLPYLIWYNLYNEDYEGKGLWVDKYGVLTRKKDGTMEYKTGGWALRRYNELLAGRFPKERILMTGGKICSGLWYRFYGETGEGRADRVLLMTRGNTLTMELYLPGNAILYNCSDGSVTTAEGEKVLTLTYEAPLIITAEDVENLVVREEN